MALRNLDRSTRILWTWCASRSISITSHQHSKVLWPMREGGHCHVAQSWDSSGCESAVMVVYVKKREIIVQLLRISQIVDALILSFGKGFIGKHWCAKGMWNTIVAETWLGQKACQCWSGTCMGGWVGMVRVCTNGSGILGNGFGCGYVGNWVSEGKFVRMNLNLVIMTSSKGLHVWCRQFMRRGLQIAQMDWCGVFSNWLVCESRPSVRSWLGCFYGWQLPNGSEKESWRILRLVYPVSFRGMAWYGLWYVSS